MAEKIVTFDMANVGPRQRVTHAHIAERTVALHWHEVGDEPDGPDGVILAKADWLRMMDAVYWKREEAVEPLDGEGANLVGMETHIGYVDLAYTKGKRKAQEEVSVLSLQQVDARMRRRRR